MGYVSLPEGNNSLMSQAFFPGWRKHWGGTLRFSMFMSLERSLLQRYLLQEKNARNYLDRVSIIKPNLELLLSLGVGLLKDIIFSGLETSKKKKTSPGYHGYKLDRPSLPNARMLSKVASRRFRDPGFLVTKKL